MDSKVATSGNTMSESNADLLFAASSSYEVIVVPARLNWETLTPEQKQEINSRSVVIEKLHHRATDHALKRHFECCGPVKQVTLRYHSNTGAPKGKAYVEFDKKSSVDNALTLTGSTFMDQAISVKPKDVNYRRPWSLMVEDEEEEEENERKEEEQSKSYQRHHQNNRHSNDRSSSRKNFQNNNQGGGRGRFGRSRKNWFEDLHI